MVTTLILSLALMAAFFLMLFAAVALVQDRRLFKSAPKDIQAAILEHKEPFRGARVIGWILLIIAVLTLLEAFLYGNQHFYPETEGCQGYRKFGFNLKEQIVRLIVYPFVVLAMAWVCTLF